MPAVTNKRFTDTQPFTPTSTLRIASQLKIATGCVLFCNLYPTSTNSKSTCGCISRIYRDDTQGVLQILSDVGEYLCSVRFDLEVTGNQLQGIATDARGSMCGSMIVRSDWLPLFFGSYSMPTTALKLLPSACRLLSVPEDAVATKEIVGDPVLRYNGKVITKIDGGGGAIKVDNDGTLYLKADTQNADTAKPISTINVNGAPISGEHIALLSAGNGLEISTSGNVITIGN